MSDNLAWSFRARLRTMAFVCLSSLELVSGSISAAPFALIVGPGATSQITAVDVATSTKVGLPLPLPTTVVHVAVAADGRRAFVSNRQSAFGQEQGFVTTLVASPLQALSTVVLPVGSPGAMAVSKDNRFVYLAGNEPSAILRYDASRESVEIINGAVGKGWGEVALDRDESKLYVARQGGIDILATASGSIIGTIEVPAIELIVGLALTQDARSLLVLVRDTNTLPQQGKLYFIDLSSGQKSLPVAVGLQPTALAASGDGARFAVTNAGDSTVTLISSASQKVLGTVKVGNNPVGLSFTPDSRFLYVTNNASSSVSVIDVESQAVAQTINDLPGAGSRGSFITPVVAPVVEYYHASLDHYFQTQAFEEITDLDRGVHPGWQRTGAALRASVPGLGSPATESPVCRFYGRPAAGLDSHFYSASPVECEAVARQFGASWQLETSQAFEIGLPNVISGLCRTGEIPVYRLWNRRTDSNHRYTTDLITRSQMIAQGYVSEGYGDKGVVMCAHP